LQYVFVALETPLGMFHLTVTMHTRAVGALTRLSVPVIAQIFGARIQPFK
jgi:hypothetical protein